MLIILFIKLTFSTIEIPLHKFLNFFEKLNIGRYKLNFNKTLNIVIAVVFFILLVNFQAKAQEVEVDSVRIEQPVATSDTIPASDTLRVKPPRRPQFTPEELDSILATIEADTVEQDSIPPLNIS